MQGSSLPGVRIDVNPTLLNNFDLSLEDVRTYLGAANANLPKGDIATGPAQLVAQHQRSADEGRRITRRW